MTSDNIPSLSPDFRRRGLIAALMAAPSLPALAQFRVEVSGVGLTQLPIALVPFRGESASPQKISAIIRADLERTGRFRAVEPGGEAMDETTRPDMSVWRQRNADSLAGGSVTRLPDGRHDVRFRLWDVVRGQDLGGQGYVVPQADLRLAAHRIADYIYEKLTGEKGVFSTRMAYVTKGGGATPVGGRCRRRERAGGAEQPEPIISPAWSPDGTQLAYVSFESRKPVIYVHDVATGKRRRCWPTSAAPTARRPGRPTACSWRSRCRAMAARSST
jgi:TolB protein